MSRRTKRKRKKRVKRKSRKNKTNLFKSKCAPKKKGDILP